jgi:uncharacterized protein YjbJ (UPF0337 family)
MNWDQIAGVWKQTKGSVRERFGKLTDDDFDQIAGNRDKFLGVLQQRYGIARDEAQKRADEWLKTLRDADLKQTARTLTGNP